MTLDPVLPVQMAARCASAYSIPSCYLWLGPLPPIPAEAQGLLGETFQTLTPPLAQVA